MTTAKTCYVVFQGGARCIRTVEAHGLCHTCNAYRYRTGKDPDGRRANFKHSDNPICSVVFASGAACGRKVEVQKFNGVCKGCNSWSLRNGNTTPHGRNGASTADRDARNADKFRAAVEAMGGTVVGSYAGTRPKVHVVCRNGHDCHPQPVDVMRGTGFCLKCRGQIHDAYYVVAGNGLVKPGITSGDPGGRLRDHAWRYGLTERLVVHTGLPDGVARWAEVEILAQLKELGAVPTRGHEFFGEEWTDSVLQLVDWYL